MSSEDWRDVVEEDFADHPVTLDMILAPTRQALLTAPPNLKRSSTSQELEERRTEAMKPLCLTCDVCNYRSLVSQDGDTECSKGHNYEKIWKGYCKEHSSGQNKNLLPEERLEKILA